MCSVQRRHSVFKSTPIGATWYDLAQLVTTSNVFSFTHTRLEPLLDSKPAFKAQTDPCSQARVMGQRANYRSKSKEDCQRRPTPARILEFWAANHPDPWCLQYASTCQPHCTVNWVCLSNIVQQKFHGPPSQLGIVLKDCCTLDLHQHNCKPSVGLGMGHKVTLSNIGRKPGIPSHCTTWPKATMAAETLLQQLQEVP